MTPELKQRLTGHIEALTAYRDGKEVEFEWLTNAGSWDDRAPDPVDQHGQLYNSWHRIKRQPKLRPFTPQEAPDQVGKVVKRKDSQSRTVITGYRESLDVFLGSEGSGTREALLLNFTFLDGSPCGVADGE